MFREYTANRRHKMIKLSDKLVQVLATSVTNNSSVELSDSKLFLLAYKEYKGTTKGQRGHITNLLNVEVTKLTKSANVQATLKKVFKLAADYVEMQVITKFDILEYSNIAGLVKLFKYVDKHVEDKSSELRESIKSLYEDNMSPHRYNNLVASKITELKEEYKLKEQEGEFVFVDVFNLVQSSVTKITQEQLHKMLELVERHIVEEQEVA